MNIEAAKVDLSFIQLGIELQNSKHFRHQIDGAFCQLIGYINRNGGAQWQRIEGNQWVSPAYVSLVESGEKLTAHNRVKHEHVVPMKILSERLLAMDDPSLEDIARFILDNVILASITKEEDKKLNDAKLTSAMPNEYYDPSHELYNNPLARYIKVGIEIYKK